MIVPQYRAAFSGRAGDLAGKIADVQLEAVRADFERFVAIENRWSVDHWFRALLDSTRPELAYLMRNGRLGAALQERLTVWRRELGFGIAE